MRQLIPCQQAFVVLFNIEAGTAQILAGSADGQLNPPEGTILLVEEFVPAELQHTSPDRGNIAITESCPSALERLMPEGSRSCMTVPLLVEENLIGELILVASQIAAFAPEHQQIAQEVAAQLAIAIQQSSLREQLQAYTTELEKRVAQRTAALEETNAELESFSYSVSHDLRAPLRTMQGFTQALLEDYGDQLDSIGQDYARYIAESAVQMDTLISDLLAYSRLSRTEIQIQPVDLSSVMSDALSQMTAELQERKAEIIVADPLPQVMAHRRTLIQVVMNLLSNAIKFVELDVQPQVRVWVEDRQDCIRLWIVDNGLGIAVEHQERIFRVFERLHGIETYPGTGIGLAIVRKGVERMGGRVGLESQIGQGSRFWLELPKVTSQQQSGNG
jgi:signal transduction histidine kinase